MLPLVDEPLLYVEGEQTAGFVPWATLPAVHRQAAQETPDPDRVERYLVEFHTRHPELSARLEHEREQLHWLATVFLLSRFLSKEVLSHPELIFQIPDVHSTFSAEAYRERLR